MNIQVLPSEKVSRALTTADAPTDYEPQVRQSTKVQSGDYQANGVMAVARRLGMAPRQPIEQVLSHLDLNGIVNKVEITEPGSTSILLDPALLADSVNRALQLGCLGITKPQVQTIIVDYSTPNVAEEIRIGHLCSATIGDASVHTLEFLGHKVVHTNHVDNWGTQSGMLTAYLEKQQQENANEMALADLEGFYREAKRHYDKDEVSAECTRSYAIRLQGGDQRFLQMWRKLVGITMSQNQTTYDCLNVALARDDVMGEGLYNPMPPGIVADLKAKGLATENKDATVVLLDEYKSREGEPMGVIIWEEGGSYLYTATDIACVKYRYETLRADRVLYYIDSRQHQHLMQARTIVRKAGYVPSSMPLEHHTLGMMLGKDSKSFKTCAGGTVKLADLLDGALRCTRYLVTEKNLDIPADELENLVKVVGIGAVKYADLSEDHTTDHAFDQDNMLAFGGNTASCMRHVYTRVLSVFRKAGIDENAIIDAPVVVAGDREARLAARLLQFEETLSMVACEGAPHVMCAYLYDLAELSPGFYEYCPILSAESEGICNSRLKLTLLATKTLKLGLDTLGIEIVERM